MRRHEWLIPNEIFFTSEFAQNVKRSFFSSLMKKIVWIKYTFSAFNIFLHLFMCNNTNTMMQDNKSSLSKMCISRPQSNWLKLNKWNIGLWMFYMHVVQLFYSWFTTAIDFVWFKASKKIYSLLKLRRICVLYSFAVALERLYTCEKEGISRVPHSLADFWENWCFRNQITTNGFDLKI